jgi:hypothetical protein
MWARLVAVVAVGLLGVSPGIGLAREPEVALRIADPRIVESSGLAASRRHHGLLWTHNDSGDAARLFGIGRDGRVLATVRLGGVEARDWEAMAAGRDHRGRPALFVGDIGDNQGLWPSVTVYRVAEPARLGDATVPVERYRLRYADGPRDAEALLVDPRSNRLYVASKALDGGVLYRAPAELRTDRVNLLRRVAAVPALVTDGAFSPNGRTFVLRDYQDAHVYAAPGRLLERLPLPPQPQGESVTFSADGADLLAGTEGPASEVWRVPVPASARPPPAPATRAPADPAPPDEQRPVGAQPTSWRPAALLLAVLTAVVALLVGLLRRPGGRRP